MEDYLYSFASDSKRQVYKELTKHQTDFLVGRYQSGEEYKKCSKALDIPGNIVRTVINNWRKYNSDIQELDVPQT